MLPCEHHLSRRSSHFPGKAEGGLCQGNVPNWPEEQLADDPRSGRIWFVALPFGPKTGPATGDQRDLLALI